MSRGTVAVIGAGPGGLSALKELREVGFDVMLFEKRSDVGGLWTFSDDPSVTSAMAWTKSQISKFISYMSDFPFPDHYPAHISAREWSDYYKMYAKNFELYDNIVFNADVDVIQRDQEKGKWVVHIKGEATPRPFDRGEDRILIIKRGSTPDDCIWFLEVDTEFVREQKKTLGTEVVAWSRGVIGDANKPIVISGPSGVGKGTLISKLMKEFPSMFGFSVSHTTRAPRDKEINGVHYHFTERSVMEKEIKDVKFLEFANVHGNLYGTSIEAVEVVADAGKRCILDIDVQGARSVRASSLEAIFIFICPPSFEELEKRLRARGTETEEQIQKRLRNAEAELEQGQSSGLFDHILVNDDLDKCYENLKKLLDLDGNVADTFSKPSPKPVELPIGHSVLKINEKVVISCRTQELEKASKNLIVLDVSSLKGGAPGRTRGLKMRAMDSFSDVVNGINQLTHS